MSLSSELGRMLLPGPKVTVTVCTVGGTDDDGNDVYEPVVFEGYLSAALKWAYENRDKVDKMVYDMPDGYILVDSGKWSYDVYGMDDVIERLEDMA